MSDEGVGRSEIDGNPAHAAHATSRPWQAFLNGDSATYCWPGWPESMAPRQGLWILSGSFNPLHAGHMAMADWVRRRFDVPVHFELSAVNVDKGQIASAEIHARLEQFMTQGPAGTGNDGEAPVASPAVTRRPARMGGAVWVTRAPTFDAKADLFEAATFIVGADTMLRIADPKYYCGGEVGLKAAIQRFEEREIRFLVFGRQVGTAFLTGLPDRLPRALRQRCEMVVEADFRIDISSTELRAQRNQS